MRGMTTHLITGAPRLPLYPPYAARLMREAAVIWAVLRVALLFAYLLVPTPLASGTLVLVLTPPASGTLVAVVAALVFLDTIVLRERVFHSNLAAAPPWIAAAALLPAAALETAAQLVTRALVS